MAKQYSYGVKSITMGAIASDGGMGTTLVDIGEIYQDSCSIVQEDPTITEHYCEQADDPILEIQQLGKRVLKFALVDVSPANLAIFLGGDTTTVDTKAAWQAPDTFVNLEKSLKITSQNDVIQQIVRGSLSGKITWNLGRKDMAKIEVTVKVLKPTKANTKGYTVIMP